MSGDEEYCVGLKDVEAAQERIQGLAHCTPLLTSATMDERSGRKLYFKCENLQRGGSFKIRGALNAVKLLAADVRDVVTHSSGNHGQALALAAKLLGKTAHIVMPDNAPVVKRAAVEGYGAKITTCESTQPAREAAAQEVLQTVPRSVLIPPYDFPNVIAGQGTMGLEMLQEVPDLDAIVVPVGGGGMLAGICIAAKGLNPNIEIIAAEPANADDCHRSVQSNTHVLLDAYPDTIADGLRTSMGKHNWPIIRDCVNAVFTVSERDIVKAQRLVWERMKLVIEPSAGVSVAVALSDAFKEHAGDRLKKVAVVLCGGNQDLDKIPWVVNKEHSQQQQQQQQQQEGTGEEMGEK